MEPIHGKHKASKLAPEDVISNMPDNVVNNILDRLPIQDAVRTGILSRKWRFKWNMLSQLVFGGNFGRYISKKEGNTNNYGRIISRLLLHLNGNITKCVLCNNLDDEDISHLILFLSRKGIKDLTLRHSCIGGPLKLPTHLFSCFELKHLKLFNCRFNPPPTFHGFPNLLSLELTLCGQNTQLGEFITRCPLLETLIVFSSGKVKLVEIAKLKNLKILTLASFKLDTTTIISSYSIFELLDSLSKLQELKLDFKHHKLTEDGGAKKKKKFLTVFPSLKALGLLRIDLDNDIKLSCVFELIKSFPNLQTIEITASESDDDTAPATCSPEMNYNTTGPLQLRSAVFVDLKGSENEVWLIEYVLASSPFLKKIDIHHRLSVSSEEKLEFSRKLLTLPRASPTAKIHLY